MRMRARVWSRERDNKDEAMAYNRGEKEARRKLSGEENEEEVSQVSLAEVNDAHCIRSV